MARRVLSCLASAAVLFIVPLALAPGRILHPAPWLGLLAAWITLASQPAVPRQAWLDARAADRRSALLIFVAMIAVQFVAIVQFGYGVAVGAPLRSGVAWLAAGFILVASGLTLRLWAIRTLGRWFTAEVRIVDGQKVVRNGPYRWLRHPSYTGALLAALGTCVALGSPWGTALLVLFAVPVYLYRIAVEEQSLVAALGGEYEDYRGVTWRVVPLIY